MLDFLNELFGKAEAPEITEPLEPIELPEGVELLERVEGSEGDESSEVSETGAYSYSDAYIDESGMYHPAQINGIYSDSLEDPECQQMAEDLSVWEHQEEPLSCAVQCQRMIIEDKVEIPVTEAELREQGTENQWFGSEYGTHLEDVGKLAEMYGMEYEQYDKSMSISDLENALESGEDVIVAVDNALLAYPYLEKSCSINHAVEVIGIDYSDAENPKVILNDPGREDGRGSAYPLEIFEKASCLTDPETGEQSLYFATTLHTKEAA